MSSPWRNRVVLLIFILFKSLSCSTASTEIPLNSSTWTPLKYEAPDDCQWWIRDSGEHSMNDEVALTCNLRTVNSEFDTTNFSVIPSEHTTSLKIQCNSEIKSKSSLTDKSFAHLTRLRELVLDYCKLGKWPTGSLTGLKDLRNLTVRTHNMDWPSVSLELSVDSFQPAKHLERLDLSTNNIYSLPENVFCSLRNILLLNLSSNRLQEVGNVGFREKLPTAPPVAGDGPFEELEKLNPTGCNLNTRILDVSFNHFAGLPSNGFSVLKNLHEMRAHDNQILHIAERALAGLKNLKLLDLSNNKIVSLPMDLFLECSESVTEIYLQNNSISALSPGLFSNLSQLLSLDLSSNQLTSIWMNNETFSGLIRLVLLNLSRNRISKLDKTLFHDLYTLQILNLEHNLLESIPADTFTALNNLHTLVLSYNRITYLEAYSLNGLYALSLLSLDNNKLQSVHPDSLKNCTALQDLYLNGNKFVSIPSAVKQMRLLKSLDLGENSITELDKPGFKGMNNLYGLRLIANHITKLTRKSFAELPSLQILNLSQNRINSIANNTFSSNLKLEAIRLDSNVLTSVEGLFTDIKSLIWLNISRNSLTEFDYSFFPSSLQWLDVHGNLISNLLNEKKVQLNLQTLDASFNKLTRISSASIPDSVELLFLNDNNVVHVEPHTFVNKVNLTRVDLYANEIVSLDLTALQLSEVKENRLLPEFYIAGNPFQCDCSMEWLQRVNKVRVRQHPVIMDMDNIYCKLTYNRERNYVPLSELKASQFLCSYKSHCYTLCQCCVFDACDCEMNCPLNCSCYHDQSWNANIVDCSASGYSEMPNKIPMDATEIYLDGNNFGELSSHSFIGRKNLKILFANNSNIQAIYNYTFSGLRKLIVLHLEFNKIQLLSGYEFDTLVNLKELYLHNNRIRFVNNRTFASQRNLEILYLDNNELIKFDVSQFVANPNLVQISLSQNPWSCECQFVSGFRVWIRDNSLKVADFQHISCLYNNITNNLGPFLIDSGNVSCITFFGSLAENQILRDYLSFLLLTSSIFVVSIFLAIGAFLYRKDLLICLYARCGFRSCYKDASFSDNGDHERLFDAYVAYCIKDEDFITQILCSNLEQQSDNSYRLCLHYRDFNVNSYVTDAIIEAAESSKRTVLVLSRNFLHTEWCRYEYKSALREVLRDRRNKTIFILLGDIPQKDLDPDLRLYLKIHTCIQWGDNLFWQKLKCAMPNLVKDHRSSTFSITSSIRNNSANVYATPTPVNSYYNLNCRSSTMNYPHPPPYTSKMSSQYMADDNSMNGSVPLRNGSVPFRNGSHRSLPKSGNISAPWH